MKIKEFALVYCQEIIEAAAHSAALLELEGFSYDDIIQEEDGKYVKVINAGEYQIPLMDILSMERADFAKVWAYPECLEAFDAYIKTLIILEGEDALRATRNLLSKEQERLKINSEIAAYFL